MMLKINSFQLYEMKTAILQIHFQKNLLFFFNLMMNLFILIQLFN